VSATIVWFRHDLRLGDHGALHAAIERGAPVLALYVWAPQEEGEWAPASAARYWLHRSLERLAADLGAAGSRLLLRRGATGPCLRALAAETGADAVYWNRRYEPAVAARDRRLARELREAGLIARDFPGALLVEPAAARTGAGGPFQVFTPFWKHCASLPDPPAPLPAPRVLPAPARWPRSDALAKLALAPRIDWAGGIRNAWESGEQGAHVALERFVDEALEHYEGRRDRPDLDGVSRLSPYLHSGEISPALLWHRLRHAEGSRGRLSPGPGAAAWLRQLYWREFAAHLLHHFPATPEAPLRAQFERFAWREDAPGLRAWQRGETGYPIVDAGMRQLWQIGWMHNRVRMVAASFLVKDLLVHWREGARWFWDTLVDADLANNTLGWQWVAGCGADAAPYFRVFNPVTQARRFDPHGCYVHRWLPELRDLPAPLVHEPWRARAADLAAARITLGRTYPRPIVDHDRARRRALDAYARIKTRA